MSSTDDHIKLHSSVARLEVITENLDKTLNKLDKRFDGIEKRMDTLANSLSFQRGRMAAVFALTGAGIVQAVNILLDKLNIKH